MAFAFSNWATETTWLWGDACSGTCTNDPLLSIYNMEFFTGSETANPNTTSSGSEVIVYDYGDSCASSWADECDGKCECSWSWPQYDPAGWNSVDAACRCVEGGYANAFTRDLVVTEENKHVVAICVLSAIHTATN